MTLARGTLLACLAACAAACVPRGDPPAGRQMVADRTAGLSGFIRPNGDGVTRLLITRGAPSVEHPYAVDLSIVSVDATGGPPVERLLVANAAGIFSGNCSMVVDCADVRGRLFVTTGFTPQGYSIMARIDPITGDRLELGEVAYFLLSPSGERLLVFGGGLMGHPTLYEADDRMIPLDERSIPAFFGEDLYYLAAEQDLMRIVPGGAPERLATGIRSFSPPFKTGNRLMTLTRPTADPTVTMISFLDVVTLEETPSPLGATPVSLSPDERWLYWYDQEAGRMTFIERTTGARDVLEFDTFLFGGGEWRPGHDEIWFSTGDYQNQSITIKVPGGPAVEVPGAAIGPTNEMGFGSMFTSDGVYWFSSASSPIEKPRYQIGSADDPTGPRFDLVPAGAAVWQYWLLADGRILTPAFINAPTRNDIYVVDPATGASSALGEAGMVLGVGQTRLLASLHINDARGDLTVVDLATERATILASEFALAAFVEPRGGDRVAPGAPVAYQFQARFASPYDGIWLATVP